MLYGLFPVIILFIGLLVWAWGPPPAQKVGEIMFACGLLAVCLAFAQHLVKLL